MISGYWGKKARRVKLRSTRRAYVCFLSAGSEPRAYQDSVIDCDHVICDDGGRLTIGCTVSIYVPVLRM